MTRIQDTRLQETRKNEYDIKTDKSKVKRQKEKGKGNRL